MRMTFNSQCPKQIVNLVGTRSFQRCKAILCVATDSTLLQCLMSRSKVECSPSGWSIKLFFPLQTTLVTPGCYVLQNDTSAWNQVKTKSHKSFHTEWCLGGKDFRGIPTGWVLITPLLPNATKTIESRPLFFCSKLWLNLDDHRHPSSSWQN